MVNCLTVVNAYMKLNCSRSGKNFQCICVSKFCTDINVDTIQDVIFKDRQVTIQYVAEALKLSICTTNHAEY